MIEIARPELWSDFDGTAVVKYGRKNLWNWTKYPLPGIDGYLDFLRGATRAGVDLAGVVTARKEWLRKAATNKSLKKLGYLGMIGPENVVYAGNEAAKGRFLAERSRANTVGIVDDNPHKVGPAILDHLLEIAPTERTTQAKKRGEKQRVAIGVVSHPKSQEYTERFIEEVREQRGDTGITVGERRNDHVYFLHGPNYGFEVSLVQLRPYDERAGEVFAMHLHDFDQVLPKLVRNPLKPS